MPVGAPAAASWGRGTGEGANKDRKGKLRRKGVGSTRPSFHKFLPWIATSVMWHTKVILTRWGPRNKGLPLLLTFLARGNGSQLGSAVSPVESGIAPLQALLMRVHLTWWELCVCTCKTYCIYGRNKILRDRYKTIL